MTRLTQAKEDYLEAILMIRKEKGYCLAVDVAHKLDVTKPSVSIALKSLEENGYIHRSENDIHLTENGLTVAESILERHLLLTEILTGIGISDQTAEHDACLIEHHLSEETFDRIRACWYSTKCPA